MSHSTPRGRQIGCLFLLVAMTITAVVLVGLAVAAAR